MVVLAVDSVRYGRLPIMVHTVYIAIVLYTSPLYCTHRHCIVQGIVYCIIGIYHQINILFQYIITGMLRFMSLHHLETVILFIE